MEYQVTHFHNSQYEEYVRFLTRFEDKKYSPEDFIGNTWWKENLSLDGFILFASTKEEIAASFTITERQWIHNDNIINSFELEGAFTLPKHQRKGLFTKLVNKAMELGFNAGAKIFYATPNERSGPGFRKLGCSFVDSENSYLICLPNIFRILAKKIGFLRGQTIKNIECNTTTKSWARDIVIYEITCDEYIRDTIGFPRINYCDEAYLRKRLQITKQNNRRFFKGIYKNTTFYSTIANHSLQFLKLIIVSEYFIDSKRDDTSRKFHFLSLIASRYYRYHDGLYLKTTINQGLLKYLDMLRWQIVVHRPLPLCYYSNCLPQQQVDDMMNQFVKIFQLTDCDIG